MKVGSD